MDIISVYKDKVLLRIYVQPGAGQNEVKGYFGDPARLKVKIKAPPVEGAANNEVIKFFSELLGISKNKIEILRGDTSRKKDLLIDCPLIELSKLLKSFE